MTAGINSQNADITIVIAAAKEYTLTLRYISILSVAFWPITVDVQSTRFKEVSLSYSSRFCLGKHFYLAGRAFFTNLA